MNPVLRTSCRQIVFLVVLLVTFNFGLPLANAQSNTAALEGTVSDQTGAMIPDADISVIETATQQQRHSSTNRDGIFLVQGLLPGTYTVRVIREGFEAVNMENIVLHVADKVSLNIRLTVGHSQQSVTVDAGGINVDTTDASVSTVVDRQFVENLPLNGRSFQSLLYLTPGVTPNPGVMAAPGNNSDKGQFVVNGQRGDSNYWMVDGVSAGVGTQIGILGAGVTGTMGATNVIGGTSSMVSVDALQEFRIETSTYAPEFGRVPGGQISIQTRSGTNQFHGTAFDYFRNTVLDATDWFASHNGLRKSPEQQNDFGGVIGGPIIKNKTFFFFSYEGFRLNLPVILLATVPDLAARQSAIPAVQPYLNEYPLPKPGAVDVSPGLAPYSTTFSNPASADAYSIRIDHELAKNLTVFGRFNHAPSSSSGGGLAVNLGGVSSLLTRTTTVGATWTKSAQVVNDARFNYSISGGKSYSVGTNKVGENLIPSPFTYQDGGLFLIPEFGSNMGFGNAGLFANFQHQYNAVDTLAMQKGKHSLKFGVDYRRLSPFDEFPHYQNWTFPGTLADWEAGTVLYTLILNQPPLTIVLHNLGVFAQDTWRVNSRLNLTYGLRWDVDFRPTTNPALPGLSGFSLTDLSNLALAPAGTPPFSTRYGNVAPRIGGAYQLLQNPDWGVVLRGGFGVFYGMVNTEIADYNLDDGFYPLAGSTFFVNTPFPTIPSVAALPPIVPPTVQNGEVLFGFDPHLNAPYALEWNVALEQSLGKAQTFTVSYIGASNKRMLGYEIITSPNANYGYAGLVGNTNTSIYNALQAQFQRRLANGLQALVSYSWAHSIDDGSYGGYYNGGFGSVNANRGSSDFDLRNVFSAAVTYNVPGLKSNTLARAITGGWSMHNIVQIDSAPPVDITDANFAGLSHSNAYFLIRPDIVPGQPFYLYGSQYPGGKALNPAAFTDPPVDPVTGLPTRQGDLGRNVLRSLGLAQWDFAVHREFPIHEAVKLQFNAEMFNVLNHPNFGLFNSTLQPGNIYFGQPTSMQNQGGDQSPLYTPGGPRSVQLALKLVF